MLDYVNGGELFYHLERRGAFSEAAARFYAAEIIIALESLHERGIVYRYGDASYPCGVIVSVWSPTPPDATGLALMQRPGARPLGTWGGGGAHGHSDLKPENVLLDGNGHVAITDFGLAKLNVTAGAGAGTFCGTAEYIAPEVLQGTTYGVCGAPVGGIAPMGLPQADSARCGARGDLPVTHTRILGGLVVAGCAVVRDPHWRTTVRVRGHPSHVQKDSVR